MVALQIVANGGLYWSLSFSHLLVVVLPAWYLANQLILATCARAEGSKASARMVSHVTTAAGLNMLR